MIHIGDKVKICEIGMMVYADYPGFLDYYRDCGSSTMVERVCSQYEYGHLPTAEEVRDKVFTVMFIREHGCIEGKILAIINDEEKTFIINVQGLTLVSSDLPFAEGDKVYIKDAGSVYSMWDSLIKNVSTVIPDGEKVRRKWTNMRSLTSAEIGGKSPEALFTVKWVGRHVARLEEDVLVIISNNAHTYIISAKGLAKAGEKSWEKYIIYVRNWAVVNKDNPQAVSDSQGPKSYSMWLRDK